MIYTARINTLRFLYFNKSAFLSDSHIFSAVLGNIFKCKVAHEWRTLPAPTHMPPYRFSTRQLPPDHK